MKTDKHSFRVKKTEKRKGIEENEKQRQERNKREKQGDLKKKK